MDRIALFPGSFDPFTRGHEALVEGALRLFDKVVIAVGDNISKRGLLTVQQRMRLIADRYAGDSRIEVASYSCLTGDFARQVGAVAMIRGIRNTTDFNFERSIEATNRRLFPEITTIMPIFRQASCASCSASTTMYRSLCPKELILRTIYKYDYAIYS